MPRPRKLRHNTVKKEIRPLLKDMTFDCLCLMNGICICPATKKANDRELEEARKRADALDARQGKRG
jgi:hypothetical protein